MPNSQESKGDLESAEAKFLPDQQLSKLRDLLRESGVNTVISSEVGLIKTKRIPEGWESPNT